MSHAEQAVLRSVQAWGRFSAALRREDSEVFERMLSEAKPIAERILESGQAVTADEAVFMAILLRIRQLANGRVDRAE